MTKTKRVNSQLPAPLQRSKKDIIATVTLSAVAMLGIGTVWATAPVRHAELTPAQQAYASPGTLAAAPQALRPVWTQSAAQVPGVARPVVVDGLVVTASGGDVHAIDPATGKTVWSYSRDLDVCSLAASFGSVVATYRNPAGCGDVTQIDAKTGTYKATRSAPNSKDVRPISSNDRVGTVSTERAELWRSDLVRTVEYGDKTEKQEPNTQPHEDCTISSALTRKELFAVTESCPGQPNNTMLRLQSASPEDSRKPKIKADVAIPGTDAALIAIGQAAAAVYVPSTPPRLIAYDDQGKEKARLDVKESPLATQFASHSEGEVFAPETSDLPHHMTWFDGQRLYLLNPATLAAEIIFEGALGTGVAIGQRVVFPVEGGLAVGDWATGTIERTIPVDRQGYRGPVSLAVAGTTLVEKRGDTLVGLAG